MIKRTLLCVSMLACVAVANAQDEMANARKMATSFFAQADAAINKGKLSTFYGMFAPSYYNVDTQGKQMSFGEFKSAIAMFMKEAKDIHSSTEIKNVQLMSDEEVVWTEQVITYSVKSQGKWMKMKETTRWAENLKMVDGKWKFASSQQLMTNEPWTFKTTG